MNSTRRKLFSKKGRTIENIPPTQDALELHLKRAVYQAGYVWSQALVPLPVLPNPADWGWLLCDGLWQPLWMTLSDAAKCCPELKRCGCGTSQNVVDALRTIYSALPFVHVMLSADSEILYLSFKWSFKIMHSLTMCTCFNLSILLI